MVLLQPQSLPEAISFDLDQPARTAQADPVGTFCNNIIFPYHRGCVSVEWFDNWSFT